MIKEITTKTAIHQREPNFGSGYDLNIYRGCEHKCKYCFAQYSHKFLENDSTNFFNDIFIKTNIVEILDNELSKKTWKNTNIINVSAISDCYQPIEEKYQLMRRCLEIFIKHKQSIFLLTKSPLILRDFDLLERLSKVAYVNIAFSITSLNEEIRQKIEPNVISSFERLKILEYFSKTNCKRTIMLTPIIPYLTDRVSDIENIFKVAKDIKCNYLICDVLNMRGMVKDNFYNFLKNNFLEVYNKIHKLYNGAYISKNYSTKLNNFINKMREKYNIYGNELIDKEYKEYVKKIQNSYDLFGYF